jgi:hypothetical protein
MPRVLIIKTLRLVNTENFIAFRTAPPFFSFLMKCLIKFSNVLEIANYTHAILGSISLIQMISELRSKLLGIQ